MVKGKFRPPQFAANLARDLPLDCSFAARYCIPKTLVGIHGSPLPSLNARDSVKNDSTGLLAVYR